MKNLSLLTLLLAVLLTATGAAIADTGGPDAFGYTFTDSNEPDGPAYDFEDISLTGSPVVLADDQVSAPIAIGFPFEFYGMPYDFVHISSNGFLSMLDGQPSGCCSGVSIPNTNFPNAIIAAWWEDFDPEEGGSIRTQLLGTAPNRRFIVQFTEIQFFDLGPSGIEFTTHQYKLFEGSNIIEVHYERMDAVSDHVVGIEDESGITGLEYLFDDAIVTPLAVQYRPPSSNQPPVCDGTPSIDTIWPPNHKFVTIDIEDVTDPDGDIVMITIDSIFQDEPLNTFGDGNTRPDGEGVGTSIARVRAERSGTKKVPGDGRVYHISYTADDGIDQCSGVVQVGVPHDQGRRRVPVDGGPLYDSTQ
ncbi:MAG: hypothetical protein HKN50_05055 [Gammaproteobacteria bacterium]|nr:hypothetical protein [Gammaproteobacteria bacterium]